MLHNSITVNVSPQKFYKELRDLTVADFTVVLNVELFMSLFGGPREPFLGDVYSTSFRLRRNWRLLWCSYHLTGTYSGSEEKTTIHYQLAPDNFWFFMIRLSGLVPFLMIGLFLMASTGVAGIIFGLLTLLAGYFIIDKIDGQLGKRLNRIFVDEVAIMRYSDKSKFRM
ncbi:MAG TPA: SoxR reducing system RseC family protein [Cyclobacteriaceae bacterium]|nr:SoxR reducing system RseC family protein [Cyclobacteriaceae bacterium]